MRFDPKNCPECGAKARGTVETLTGLALLNFDEDGEAEYDGETKINWDSQCSVIDADGKVTLECWRGHQWQASLDESNLKQ